MVLQWVDGVGPLEAAAEHLARHHKRLGLRLDDGAVLLDGEGDRAGQLPQGNRFWRHRRERTRPVGR